MTVQSIEIFMNGSFHLRFHVPSNTKLHIEPACPGIIDTVLSILDNDIRV